MLIEALKNEEIRLHEVRAQDTPVDAAVLANAAQKLQEIARLKELLGPVLMSGRSTTTTETVERAKNLMKGKMPTNRGLQ